MPDTALPSRSRRRFLASVGAAASVATVALPARADSTAALRGLVPADDFLFEPGLKYFQTGSLGATPRPVIDRTLAAWREMEQNPAAWGYGAHEQALETVRAKAAALLGCATDELVLTNCTTEGMNWIAQGLGLERGDHVLTTDQEHPGGRACWDYLVKRHGIVLDVVTLPLDLHDARGIVDRFAAAITPRTKAFSFSHVLSSTGLRMPVADLSALARAHHALSIVDGAQAVGAIRVDVKALGCHAYATSGHKWLLAPKGTGLLYLSADAGDAIRPIALEGGRLAYSASSGVCSLPSVIGMGATIDYVTAIGLDRIEAHNLALRERLAVALRDVRRVRVVSAPAGPLASPMLTFALPEGVQAPAFHARMRERHHCEIKVVPGQWLNGHRISLHLYNTADEVDTLARVLREELA